jgi:hypothetical protein
MHLARFAWIASFCCAVIFGYCAKATSEVPRHAPTITSAELIKISRFTMDDFPRLLHGRQDRRGWRGFRVWILAAPASGQPVGCPRTAADASTARPALGPANRRALFATATDREQLATILLLNSVARGGTGRHEGRGGRAKTLIFSGQNNTRGHRTGRSQPNSPDGCWCRPGSSWRSARRSPTCGAGRSQHRAFPFARPAVGGAQSGAGHRDFDLPKGAQQRAPAAAMTVARDLSLPTLARRLRAAGIARARQHLVELAFQHRLQEAANSTPKASFDRVKLVVEKMHCRLGFRLRQANRRDIACHGVISAGAPTPESLVGSSWRLRRLHFPTLPIRHPNESL